MISADSTGSSRQYMRRQDDQQEVFQIGVKCQELNNKLQNYLVLVSVKR